MGQAAMQAALTSGLCGPADVMVLKVYAEGRDAE